MDDPLCHAGQPKSLFILLTPTPSTSSCTPTPITPPPKKKKNKKKKERKKEQAALRLEKIFCFRYTSKKTGSGVSVYAILLKWPSSGRLLLGSPQPTGQTSVTLLGYSQPIAWSKGHLGGLQLTIPTIPANQMPCQWAWVFKLDNLFNA